MSELQDKIDLIRRLRESGNVYRCHALPHYDEYTDGKHSFDAVSMLLVLHPDPSRNLITALLWHDMAERYVGDMPASAKFASSSLAMEYALLEDKIIGEKYGKLKEVIESLTELEIQWLKCLDAMEFAMWCQDQMNAGNRHVEQAWRNIQEYLAKMQMDGKMPPECLEFFNGGGLHYWERLPERFDR